MTASPERHEGAIGNDGDDITQKRTGREASREGGTQGGKQAALPR